LIGGKLQIRPVDVADFGRVREAEEALDLEGVFGRRVEALGNLPAQGPWHPLFDLEPDHLPAPPLPQRRLELDHEIRRLVIDFDFAVADDPERARADDLVT